MFSAQTPDPVAQSPRPGAPPRYHKEAVVATTITKQFKPPQIALLEKLNRRDLDHLIRLKEMIVPDEWSEEELLYSPLPATWAWAESSPKVIVVSQPAQVFGAFEFGRLVYWGPVSSGRLETPTPAGVFNLTWKAKSRRSTDNENWLLEWYFNFINARGVSFHKFELPGLPASHACVRLLERDAQWVYAWGEQWKLSANGRDVIQPGSTVVILGTYDFGRPAPWLSLDWWQTLIDLPAQPTNGDQ
jgi:lipoprotein-anchoring transpeptidase ErfK/SrfK